MKNNVLYYSVGPLLYCPANRISITDSLINERFGNRFSLALCLEDTINDDHVEEAEQILISSLSQIFIQHEQKAILSAQNIYPGSESTANSEINKSSWAIH